MNIFYKHLALYVVISNLRHNLQAVAAVSVCTVVVVVVVACTAAVVVAAGAGTVADLGIGPRSRMSGNICVSIHYLETYLVSYNLTAELYGAKHTNK